MLPWSKNYKSQQEAFLCISISYFQFLFEVFNHQNAFPIQISNSKCQNQQNQLVLFKKNERVLLSLTLTGTENIETKSF